MSSGSGNGSTQFLMRSLVLNTDVTSYIFKWHPLASAYLDLVKNAELVISFMTLGVAPRQERI